MSTHVCHQFTMGKNKTFSLLVHLQRSRWVKISHNPILDGIQIFHLFLHEENFTKKIFEEKRSNGRLKHSTKSVRKQLHAQLNLNEVLVFEVSFIAHFHA